MLTRASNTCTFGAYTRAECGEPIWDNSILMASLSFCLIFSKLHLFSSSTSLLHSSIRFSIIFINCCGLIEAEEVLEPCVVTYPIVGGRREAQGCVFQGRKTCGVATNIYSRKTLEKTKNGLQILRIKGSEFVYVQGRY